jgi:hypothetical protein
LRGKKRRDNANWQREINGMINSIQIDGYRGFDAFEMTDLGLVNLLVGRNNSGKTSVLEAIYLLTSKGDPMAIWRLLWKRGEQLPEERQREVGPELDICHLFNGHNLQVGSKIVFSAKNESPKRHIELEIAEPSAKDREKYSPRFPLVLNIKGNQVPANTSIPISRKGGMPSEFFEMPRRIRGRFSDDSERAQFITTDSLNANDLVKMWEKIQLTPNENIALSAMQFLDPTIERIASQSVTDHYLGVTRGGFKVKQKGCEQPVPIGSLGDGMWRMLAMAIAISSTSKGPEGGVLLVDEIDTGLHHTAMTQMWELLYNAAKKFGVQIFATTHSSDCVHSLARICSDIRDDEFRVTLHRIESGKKKSVPYSEGEIKMAAERKIEVR